MAKTPPLPGQRVIPFWGQIEEPEDPTPICSLCLDVPIGWIRPGDPADHHDTLRLKTCGHVFGRNCLLDYYDADVRVHKCPTCRQAFRPPRSLVYDPSEDLIVPEDGNWAMNVPGRPGMRIQGEYAGRLRSVEDSFYDLEFFDRADDIRLARRTLPPAFYVSGNYGAFKGNVREAQRDERRILFTHGNESIGEAEFDRLIAFAKLPRVEADPMVPKDFERVRYQWVTVRAQHMSKNLMTLWSQMHFRPEYGIRMGSPLHAVVLEVLAALEQWCGEYDGMMCQLETLQENMVTTLSNTWPTVTRDECPQGAELLFTHIVQCLALARLTREMEAFGRLP
ncbi:uncharacterized protein J3D65DRAFT_605130 [Phyllosticta citribraziliensis]|uniref:RING-type domain-containing protein n=1 Tax=Phyllosticta citribraziliensis TaxID=989973 RepID=A0ABR1LFY1_9PEZI